MNQKLISLTSAALIAASLAACGSATAEAPSTVPSTAAPTQAATEATKPTVSFEETTLVENDSITFRITAVEDSTRGYTLKAYLENHTDMDLMFSISEASVNGFMCDPLWAVTVSAGMKSNESIRFSRDSFAANGITEATDIEFKLDVYDSNDWMADHLVSEVFTLYPMGEDAAQVYERESQETDIVLFDDENCTMIVTGFDPENLWGYTMNVYLHNQTDKTLMFSLDGASVNGFMCDPFWAETVAPGKQSNTTISWSDSAFAENGITDVESLTLPLRVYDANDWMAEDVLNETYTVNP